MSLNAEALLADDMEVYDSSINDLDERLFSAYFKKEFGQFSAHTLPYSGLGSGMRRAFAAQRNIELINDLGGEQFMVRIPRPE